MPKVDSIDCPGCGKKLPIKKTKPNKAGVSKPYVRCDDPECGVQVFVRGAKGVRKFFGDGEHTPPAKAEPAPGEKGKGKPFSLTDW